MEEVIGQTVSSGEVKPHLAQREKTTEIMVTIGGVAGEACAAPPSSEHRKDQDHFSITW